MKHLRALMTFDFSRCWKGQCVWWIFCLVQMGTGIGIRYGMSEEVPPHRDLFVPLGYLLLAIFVGMLVQPANPGEPGSFFRARPVGAGELLRARLFYIAALLLLPLYLARLVPLLLIEPGFGTVSAYTVHFWGTHIGVVVFLGAIAAGTSKASSFLVVSLFSFVLMEILTNLTGKLEHRESNWIAVASPEAAELLWHCGLALAGAFIFGFVMRTLYRGDRSWKRTAVVILTALVIAAARQPIRFVTDVSKVGHPVTPEVVDVSLLTFEAGRDSPRRGYETQRNRKKGQSIYMQSKPPYWNGEEERFWFIRGQFDVKGLDPDLAYSARLLDARWIAPDGETVPYDPPLGTFSIRNHHHTLPPPPPTSSRLNALLGPAPDTPYVRENTGVTQVLLFGTRTSVYERYKDTPGRLEMRVRIDFHTHEAKSIIPLGESGFTDLSNGVLRLADVSVIGGKLNFRTFAWRAAKRWHVRIEDRWNRSGDRMLYDPETGYRGTQFASASSGSTVFGPLQRIRAERTFDPDDQIYHLPDLTNYASLQLVHIAPRYLGSAEVDVVVENFPLVTQETIERAIEHDKNPH